MTTPNRSCVVCGKKYYYCSSTNCQESFGKPTWMIMFHDENCKNIFSIISEHYHNRLSDVEAMKQLEQCDLSKKDEFLFSKDVKKDLENILSKKKLNESKVSCKQDVDKQHYKK